MPASEYKNVVSGGLKLKGAPAGAGVTKKKKKSKDPSKKKPQDAGEEAKEDSASRDTPKAEDDAPAGAEKGDDEADAERAVERKLEDQIIAKESPGPPVAGAGAAGYGKTDAQRRHEEIKRKRLDDRLRREGGAKTHKQRVEELNKYLSTLSEHHDMPRIGPG